MAPRPGPAAWRVAPWSLIVLLFLASPSLQQQAADYLREGDPPRIAARNLYEYRHLQRAPLHTSHYVILLEYTCVHLNWHRCAPAASGAWTAVSTTHWSVADGCSAPPTTNWFSF